MPASCTSCSRGGPRCFRSELTAPSAHHPPPGTGFSGKRSGAGRSSIRRADDFVGHIGARTYLGEPLPLAAEPRGPQTAELAELIVSCSWLLNVLTTVREACLPDAWVGAGVLRDLVWGQRYGAGFNPRDVRDVDVAFFDANDLTPGSDVAATELLRRHDPAVPWEATNQAAVHTSVPRLGWTTCSMGYGGAIHEGSRSSFHERVSRAMTPADAGRKSRSFRRSRTAIRIAKSTHQPRPCLTTTDGLSRRTSPRPARSDLLLTPGRSRRPASAH